MPRPAMRAGARALGRGRAGGRAAADVGEFGWVSGTNPEPARRFTSARACASRRPATSPAAPRSRSPGAATRGPRGLDVGDGVFGSGEDAAAVFRIEPAKVLAFAKEPHAQTTFRFGGG